jgi:hypothetical protein
LDVRVNPDELARSEDSESGGLVKNLNYLISVYTFEQPSAIYGSKNMAVAESAVCEHDGVN